MQGYPTNPDPQQSPQPQQPQPMSQQNPPAYGPPQFAPTPAPGAPNAPQSNRNKLLIGGGIGCGVLLILCMCVGLISAIASQGNTSASSGGSPTATTAQQHTNAPQAASTPQATPAPKATATPKPQPKWVVTHTYNGNGIQKTDTFTVNSDHWRIAWSCNPKAYGSEYNLIADLTAPGDDFGDSVVNVICKSNDPSSMAGETNEYSAGTYYLDVTSEGPWTFQVEEFK